MRRDWDARASSNAFHFVDSNRTEWTDEEFYGRGRQLVAQMLDPVLAQFGVDPSGKRVLEIGCGVGRLFEGFSSRFGEVWGIDVSPNMVALGKEHCPVEATWLVGSGTALTGVEDESVDHVVSYEVFQHIPDPGVIDAYVAEIHRVLRPVATFQVHLRKGSDSLPQAAVRVLPRSARRVVGDGLRRTHVLEVDGDIDTWLGCVIPPARAVRMATGLGFVEVETLPDELHRHQRDMGYWLVGRKPS